MIAVELDFPRSGRADGVWRSGPEQLHWELCGDHASIDKTLRDQYPHGWYWSWGDHAHLEGPVESQAAARSAVKELAVAELEWERRIEACVWRVSFDHILDVVEAETLEQDDYYDSSPSARIYRAGEP